MTQPSETETPTTTTPTTPCIVPGCTRKGSPKRRGLCMKCYAFVKAKVKAGEVTWAQLEAAGKVLAKPTRKPRGPNATTPIKVTEDWLADVKA